MLRHSHRSTLLAVFSVVAIGGSTQAQLPSTYNIRSSSGEAELNLAQQLKQHGAKLYVNSAMQCAPIDDQLTLFGRQAAAQLNVIDCGNKNQAKQCESLAIRNSEFAYPSWEIDGKLHVGRISLEQLSNLVNYQGDRTFKNSLPTRKFDPKNSPSLQLLPHSRI